MCQKSFKLARYLTRHMVVHTGLKSDKCKVCQKAFSRSDQIKAHFGIQVDLKPCSCNFRFASFRCSSHLIVHSRTRTGEKPYKCGICTKAFTTYGNLGAHQTSRHINLTKVSKTYLCTFCPRWCLNSYGLRFHLLSHFREKPYACTKCSLEYSKPRSLRKHVGAVHK